MAAQTTTADRATTLCCYGRHGCMQDVIVNVNAVQGKEEDRKIKRHVCAGESLIVLGASAQRNQHTCP